MTTKINNLQTNSGLSNDEFNRILKFYKAWDTNDTTSVDDICHPEWQDIPLAPGQATGPAGLKDLIHFFNDAFPDIAVIINDIFGTTERVVVRAELVFTHNKPLMGIPPSNQKVKVRLFEIHHIRDGKITHTWHQEDWFGLLLQSGTWKIN